MERRKKDRSRSPTDVKQRDRDRYSREHDRDRHRRSDADYRRERSKSSSHDHGEREHRPRSDPRERNKRDRHQERLNNPRRQDYNDRDNRSRSNMERHDYRRRNGREDDDGLTRQCRDRSPERVAQRTREQREGRGRDGRQDFRGDRDQNQDQRGQRRRGYQGRQKRPRQESDDEPDDTSRYGRPAGEDGTHETAVEAEKPNFGLSGKLTEYTNTYKGVVIKYNEPPEGRKPKTRWRLYPFKGEQGLPVLYIHRQSAYLLGRQRHIADIPIDHPSCSKQHAVLQYRLTNYERPDGTAGRKVKPYIIDLESANGTFLNNEKIDPRRYYELKERDVLKFGFSSREYVILHERSMNSEVENTSAVSSESGSDSSPE